MNELNPTQQLAIDLLASGCNNRSTAERAGIAESTLYNWLKQAEFRSTLDDRLNQVRQASLDEIKRLTTSAVKKLESLMSAEYEDVPASVQFQAASKILELAFPKNQPIAPSNADGAEDPALTFFRKLTGADFVINRDNVHATPESPVKIDSYTHYRG